jgi:hypothetical protein
MQLRRGLGRISYMLAFSLDLWVGSDEISLSRAVLHPERT